MLQMMKRVVILIAPLIASLIGFVKALLYLTSMVMHGVKVNMSVSIGQIFQKLELSLSNHSAEFVVGHGAGLSFGIGLADEFA
jgi:hypothetical protein